MEKPLPNPSEDSEAYWQACKRERLSTPLCAGCGHRWLPPSKLCPVCLSEDVALAPVSGRATLHSWVVVHNSQHPAFFGEPAYNVAIVRLEEGPMLHSRIDGVGVEHLRVGMALEVAYEHADDEIALPIFRPQAIDGDAAREEAD